LTKHTSDIYNSEPNTTIKKKEKVHRNWAKSYMKILNQQQQIQKTAH